MVVAVVVCVCVCLLCSRIVMSRIWVFAGTHAPHYPSETTHARVLQLRSLIRIVYENARSVCSSSLKINIFYSEVERVCRRSILYNSIEQHRSIDIYVYMSCDKRICIEMHTFYTHSVLYPGRIACNFPTHKSITQRSRWECTYTHKSFGFRPLKEETPPSSPHTTRRLTLCRLAYRLPVTR